MCEDCFSWCKNEASIAVRRSLCPCCATTGSLPGTIGSVKLLGIVLAVQVAIGLTLVALVATDNLPVVPDGLRNVIGTVRGRERGYVVVGAHYDTKDIRGFVGANDGASGTAVALQLARTLRRPRHTIQFVFFDGEEAPRGIPDNRFERYGLRGSKVAAPVFRDARAMILLDFVGDKHLTLRRESYSDVRLWKRLRQTAERVGAEAVFPTTTQGGVLDDHIPFRSLGVPSIDLIDFDFPCWHRTCDDMSAVSERSVDAVGETMYEFVRGL